MHVCTIHTYVHMYVCIMCVSAPLSSGATYHYATEQIGLF